MAVTARSRFRIHLSTVLIFTFCFGTLAYFCIFQRLDRPGFSTTEGYAFGFPMMLVVSGKGRLPDGREFTYHNYRSGVRALAPAVNRYFFGCLIVNLAVALIPSLLVARYFERRARRHDPKPVEESEEEFDEDETKA